MAPSVMEHSQEQTLGQGYTHKKFNNCGYSHKKLGMRMRARAEAAAAAAAAAGEQATSQEQQLQQTTSDQQEKITKPQQNKLFRPYALDDDESSKKRKIQDLECNTKMESQKKLQITATQLPQQLTIQATNANEQQTAAASTCPAPALSPNSYAQRLQRQRAALYMRYISQFQAGSQQILFTPHQLQQFQLQQQQLQQLMLQPQSAAYAMAYANPAIPASTPSSTNGC